MEDEESKKSPDRKIQWQNDVPAVRHTWDGGPEGFFKEKESQRQSALKEMFADHVSDPNDVLPPNFYSELKKQPDVCEEVSSHYHGMFLVDGEWLPGQLDKGIVIFNKSNNKKEEDTPVGFKKANSKKLFDRLLKNSPNRNNLTA